MIFQSIPAASRVIANQRMSRLAVVAFAEPAGPPDGEAQRLGTHR